MHQSPVASRLYPLLTVNTSCRPWKSGSAAGEKVVKTSAGSDYLVPRDTSVRPVTYGTTGHKRRTGTPKPPPSSPLGDLDTVQSPCRLKPCPTTRSTTPNPGSSLPSASGSAAAAQQPQPLSQAAAVNPNQQAAAANATSASASASTSASQPQAPGSAHQPQARPLPALPRVRACFLLSLSLSLKPQPLPQHWPLPQPSPQASGSAHQPRALPYLPYHAYDPAFCK